MTDTTAPHTPGPWWRDEDGFIAAGSGDSYVTIADFDCSDDIDPDEREANKSLAMAAPAMRAALSDAIAFMSGAFDGGEDEINGGDLVEWFSGWRETAKAALAGQSAETVIRHEGDDDWTVRGFLVTVDYQDNEGREGSTRIFVSGDDEDAARDEACSKVRCWSNVMKIVGGTVEAAS